MDTISDCMGRTLHTVGLVDFGDKASPTILNQKLLLETAQDKTRSLKKIMGLKNPDEFMAKWTQVAGSTPETHDFSNTIVLPPWILRAILAKEASSVDEIFIAVRDAAICQDTLLHEEDEENKEE